MFLWRGLLGAWGRDNDPRGGGREGEAPSDTPKYQATRPGDHNHGGPLSLSFPLPPSNREPRIEVSRTEASSTVIESGRPFTPSPGLTALTRTGGSPGSGYRSGSGFRTNGKRGTTRPHLVLECCRCRCVTDTGPLRSLKLGPRSGPLSNEPSLLVFERRVGY